MQITGALPYLSSLDLTRGVLTPGRRKATHLSDLADYFADRAAVAARLAAGDDPVVYEVYVGEMPQERAGATAGAAAGASEGASAGVSTALGPGQISFGTTVIHPGDVAGEFYMTRGHFHSLTDRDEVYLGLAGRGLLLMEDREGRFAVVEMGPGALAYVPGAFAHRTVNTGEEDFVFLALYPADGGHDYGSIRERGFSRRVFAVPAADGGGRTAVLRAVGG